MSNVDINLAQIAMRLSGSDKVPVSRDAALKTIAMSLSESTETPSTVDAALEVIEQSIEEPFYYYMSIDKILETLKPYKDAEQAGNGKQNTLEGALRALGATLYITSRGIRYQLAVDRLIEGDSIDNYEFFLTLDGDKDINNLDVTSNTTSREIRSDGRIWFYGPWLTPWTLDRIIEFKIYRKGDRSECIRWYGSVLGYLYGMLSKGTSSKVNLDFYRGMVVYGLSSIRFQFGPTAPVPYPIPTLPLTND